MPDDITPIVCEFCGCTLASSGQVLTRGDAATTFQALDQNLAFVQKLLDAANKRIEELSRSPEPLPAKRRSGFLGMRSDE